MQDDSFLGRLNRWARNSVTLKLFVVGILILILLIPVSMVTSLIREREGIRDEAVREVSAKWGGDQTIAGPVISVPYRSTRLNQEGQPIITRGYVHFLPDSVTINGQADPQKRYRGIYLVVLYNTRLEVSGRFEALNAEALSVPEEDLQWEDALFTVGISDMKGIEEAVSVRINDTAYQLGPGTVTNDLLASGASFPIALPREKASAIDFSFRLNLNGSSSLYFTPFGKSTTVTIQSSWPDPSFEGAFLPDSRTVSADGFSASWQVLQLNRNYPQQGEGPYINNSPQPASDPYGYKYDAFRASTSAFGVRLLLPIDEYQKTMRSAKYAAFFVLITFLAFFFIEVLNRKRLHPIQYILVGAAIILFYILLLSISEHFNFDTAYLIACVIILALITGYCSYILQNRRLTWMMFGILALLYGFFYSLLQLQDYALLLGSLGLLLILATIMYLTRNIDWYGLRGEEEG
ncbi:MAG: cell envelope integrity protein CreD [Lewinellaceae bacterium]|nr:cell envelope integrity protein CreD [Phaeodactylibacter sp.]MCB0615053.1 cell envelope integrity protein CreD [Phaeodactylibacter sp.]MCB9346928.1 cell envelope integrity protein CreD [Lewinellaceae bacterium]